MDEKRFRDEVVNLARYFERIEYSEKDRWIIIVNYPLPPQVNLKFTPLLIKIPHGYPFVPPREIYLKKGLSLMENMRDHYFEDWDSTTASGWAWLCCEIKNWLPSSTDILLGDNLVTLTETVRSMLSAYNKEDI